MQYKFNGPNPVSIPALGLDLQPGDKFDTDAEINHPHFDLLPKKKTDADKTEEVS